MKTEYTRFDFYLSYWIFAWAIIYILVNWYFKKKSSTNYYINFFIQNCNPLISICIALVITIFSLLLLIIYNASSLIIILYILLIITIKIIPIYILLYLKPNPFISNVKPNIITSIFVFIVYNLYLKINGINMYNFYSKGFTKIIEGKTPFLNLIKKISQKLING